MQAVLVSAARTSSTRRWTAVTGAKTISVMMMIKYIINKLKGTTARTRTACKKRMSIQDRRMATISSKEHIVCLPTCRSRRRGFRRSIRNLLMSSRRLLTNKTNKSSLTIMQVMSAVFSTRTSKQIIRRLRWQFLIRTISQWSILSCP